MSTPARSSEARGFTLVELLVTLVVLAVVMLSLMAVMYGTTRSKTATMNQLESVQAVRAGLDMLTRDLRSAGYGADIDYSPLPQPSIETDASPSRALMYGRSATPGIRQV